MNKLQLTDIHRHPSSSTTGKWSPEVRRPLIALCVLAGTFAVSGCGSAGEPVESAPVEEPAPVVAPPSRPQPSPSGPDISQVRVPAGHPVWSPNFAGALLGLDNKVYEGYKRSTVARIQQALRDRGFYPGDIDSDFDQDTMEAVADFQAAHRLNLTGVPTPLTRSALIPADAASLKPEQAFHVQVGVFSNPANSERLTKKLKDLRFEAQAEPTAQNQLVVSVGPFTDRGSAEEAAQTIKEVTSLTPLIKRY